MPCDTGCFTSAAAAAFGAEPCPASLEYRPRLMPLSMVCEIRPPSRPPPAASKRKALPKIWPNTAGTALIFIAMTYTAISRYKIAIIGTSPSAMRETRRMPPKIIGAERMTKATPTAWLSQLHDPLAATAMVLDCTAL